MILLNPDRCSCRRTRKEKKRGEEEEALCSLPLKPQEAEDERVKVSNCQNVILKVIFQARSAPQCHLSSSKVGIEETKKHRIFCTKTELLIQRQKRCQSPNRLSGTAFFWEICAARVHLYWGTISSFPRPYPTWVSALAELTMAFSSSSKSKNIKEVCIFNSYSLHLNETPDLQFNTVIMLMINTIINFLAFSSKRP